MSSSEINQGWKKDKRQHPIQTFLQLIFAPKCLSQAVVSAASLWSVLALGLYVTKQVTYYVHFGTTHIVRIRRLVQTWSETNANALFSWHIKLYVTLAGGIAVTAVILISSYLKDRYPRVTTLLQLGAWAFAIGWFVFINRDSLINSTIPGRDVPPLF